MFILLCGLGALFSVRYLELCLVSWLFVYSFPSVSTAQFILLPPGPALWCGCSIRDEGGVCDTKEVARKSAPERLSRYSSHPSPEEEGANFLHGSSGAASQARTGCTLFCLHGNTSNHRRNDHHIRHICQIRPCCNFKPEFDLFVTSMIWRETC